MLATEQRWLVITTKSRAEKKVALGLEKLGIECFLPLQKQLKQWKDRKKWVEIPLFGAYVFVKLNDQNRNLVFQVPGVVKFLSIKGELSCLREDEIERIGKICRQENEVTISHEQMMTGAMVTITEGPLKGLKGRVGDKANNAYLYIWIENLGFTASFKIEKKWVTLLT